MPSIIESLVDTSGDAPVRGTLHRPPKPTGDGLVLTHGAGGNRDTPLLVALAEQLPEAGITTLRCDLPFRQSRPTGPPRGSGGEDQAGLKRAIELLRETGLQRVFLGGQSYGGRMASMLVAEEPASCDGLLLLSYPLHPPGKPTQLRTKHLCQLQVPALFVSGPKDPFGTPEEIQSAITMITSKTSFLQIENAGHDLGYGRKPSRKMQDVPQRIAQAFLNFLVRP